MVRVGKKHKISVEQFFKNKKKQTKSFNIRGKLEKIMEYPTCLYVTLHPHSRYNHPFDICNTDDRKCNTYTKATNTLTCNWYLYIETDQLEYMKLTYRLGQI